MTLLMRLSEIWYSRPMRWLNSRVMIQARPTFCYEGKAGELASHDGRTPEPLSHGSSSATVNIYDIFRRPGVNDKFDFIRYYMLFLQVRRIEKQQIPGDIAELGVYLGATAELISRLSSRQLHLFDTFSGFDARDGDDSGNFSNCSEEHVRRLCPEARIYPGWFPETTKDLPADVRFAMVHIDMDLEKPIRAALEFFYGRTSPGAAIIVHDYNGVDRYEGEVKRAVDGFLADKPEVAVEMPDRYGSVLIVKG